MQNIAKIVNDYLLENVLTDYDVIYNDVFPDDEDESIISRYDPSQAKETEYIDGSAVGAVPLSYYIRSADAEKARTLLNELVGAIDNMSCVNEDNGTEYLFEAVTLPNFVSVDDKNNSIYTVTITARYERRGQ